jgi:hypothetical protein
LAIVRGRIHSLAFTRRYSGFFVHLSCSTPCSQDDSSTRSKSLVKRHEATLMSEFGVSEQATITRVERQFGGGRIPQVIDTFGELAKLPDFNPFTKIEVINGTVPGARTLRSSATICTHVPKLFYVGTTSPSTVSTTLRFEGC